MEPTPRDSLSPSPVAAPPGTGVRVRCWGTRGSIPSPGPATAGYGGNTPCVEVRVGEQRVVFDAGSGMRLLGLDVQEESRPADVTIFLSHFHWDHIQGFPFFAPLYQPEARLRIVGPAQQDMDVRSLFAGQMGPIYFPVPFSAVAATATFDHLNEGTWEEGGIRVSAMRVRHPSFTVGYRLEAEGRTLCYVPDNELVGASHETADRWRERFTRFVGGADVLIHDAMYTDEEYASKEGWGHSTFRQAVELAADAGVRRLLFFHHAPERSDAALTAIVRARRKEADALGLGLEVDAASEGVDLTLDAR
ncbi:MAG: MBL fold metallo-hydrolase [Gemmatimonadetes bacterium]|nr:MBL fold metallo-hydrolase [Gemmatimonadota bacterium]